MHSKKLAYFQSAFAKLGLGPFGAEIAIAEAIQTRFQRDWPLCGTTICQVCYRSQGYLAYHKIEAAVGLQMSDTDCMRMKISEEGLAKQRGTWYDKSSLGLSTDYTCASMLCRYCRGSCLPFRKFTGRSPLLLLPGQLKLGCTENR